MNKPPGDKPDQRKKILDKIDELLAELVELGLEEDSDFSKREEETLDLINRIGRGI